MIDAIKPFDDGRKKIYTEAEVYALFAEDEKKKVLGIIAVADEIKDDSPQAVQMLKNMNIVPYMITGDNKLTAKAVGEQIGLKGNVMEGMEIDELSDKKLIKIIRNTPAIIAYSAI